MDKCLKWFDYCQIFCGLLTRDWGIFFLLLVSGFSCSSLVAGGLASGQHAHNPHQNSSHHFIFPVLWLSLASVCKYGNSACECHWWAIMKISLWLPQMGKTGALDKSSNIYLRDKRRLNYFSCKLMSSVVLGFLRSSDEYVYGFYYIWISSKPIIYENNSV